MFLEIIGRAVIIGRVILSLDFRKDFQHSMNKDLCEKFFSPQFFLRGTHNQKEAIKEKMEQVMFTDN